MPPKKEIKEKAVKGDEAEEIVLQYMKSVNRPYAATDVSVNLKGKVAKPQAQKTLALLAERGDLSFKPYGKQTIYVYNQRFLPVLGADEMGKMDNQMKATNEALDEQRKIYKAIQTDLSSKEALPKTRDLEGEIERVKAEIEHTAQVLAPFRGEDGQPKIAALSFEEIRKIDEDFARWRRTWTDRYRVYKSLIDIFKDGGIVADPSFEEDQGINLDDDEAKEVDQGEFCRPQNKIIPKKPSTSTKPGTSGAGLGAAGVNGMKKSDTGRSSSGGVVSVVASQEETKKKKVKRA